MMDWKNIHPDQVSDFLTGRISLEKCVGNEQWITHVLKRTYRSAFKSVPGMFGNADSHYISDSIAKDLGGIIKLGFWEDEAKSESKMGTLINATKNKEAQLDLTGADLSGIDLTGANLMRATLVNVNLVGTNLTKACLIVADLSGAKFYDFEKFRTILQNNSLEDESNSIISSSTVNLSEAELSNASLVETNLSSAKLARSILYNADLTGSILRGADLTEANLRDADLTDAQLAGIRLTGAILRGVRTNAPHLWEMVHPACFPCVTQITRTDANF